MDEAVQQYLEKALASGESQENIRQTLVQRFGWLHDEVDALFAELAQPATGKPVPAGEPAEPVPQPQPASGNLSQDSEKQKFIALFALTAALAVGLLGYLVFSNLSFGGGPLKEATFARQISQSLVGVDSFSTRVQVQFNFEERESDAVATELDDSYDFYAEGLSPNVSANFDLYLSSTAAGTDSNFEARIDASYVDNIDTFDLGADVRLVDESFFAQLRRAPDMLGLFFPVPLNQWVRFPLDDLANFIPDPAVVATAEEQEKVISEAILKAIDDSRLIAILSSPNKEELNGETVYRYKIGIRFENIPDFLPQVYDNVVAAAPELADDLSKEDFITEATAAIEEYDLEAFATIQESVDFFVLVNDDSFPVQTEINYRWVPPESATELANYQGRFMFRTTLSDINQPLQVKAPENYIEFEALMQQMMGGMMDPFADFQPVPTCGYLVTSVRGGSPVAEAGLMVGETITAVNGERVTADNMMLLLRPQVGQPMNFTTDFGMQYQVVPGESPDGRAVLGLGYEISVADCENSPAQMQDGVQDASIKQLLGNARSQAELVYNQDGFTYSNVCSNETIQALLQGAVDNRAESLAVQTSGVGNATSVTCSDNTNGYAIEAPLNELDAEARVQAWCVDSFGYAGYALIGSINGDSAVEDIICDGVGTI